MYNVDQERIEHILNFLEFRIKQSNFLQLPQGTESLNGINEVAIQLSMERLLDLYVEIFTDVADLLINGFIMRDPGGFDDMVDIMEDEKVIPNESAIILHDLVLFYRRLKKDYHNIEQGEVVNVFQKTTPYMSLFSKQVRDYLVQELA